MLSEKKKTDTKGKCYMISLMWEQKNLNLESRNLVARGKEVGEMKRYWS